ncbi:MAG: RsmD family RNA methyltransferase [Rikenellaceae bacterium]
MTIEELEILCEEQTQGQIDLNIERNHCDVALDKSLCHSALIATQVKYLQRSRGKLPSYYNARCIIPPRAFEQSSSEATAEVKRLEGESVLELTCGLGVDALSLSKRFKRVVTLERDEVLAEVAKENFRRLKATNIEVVNSSAEEYLSRCNDHFDWVYADPDRRSEDGRKMVLLEDCSPNILSLMDQIKRVSRAVMIKCSPLFDVDEAFRLFPRSTVEVVSLNDECKEVVISKIFNEQAQEKITATAIGRGEITLPREATKEIETPTYNPENYKYLLLPDVSIQKSRLARRHLNQTCDIWCDNGFGFADDQYLARLEKNHYLAVSQRIVWIGEYDPKRCSKELAARGIKRAEILKREFPHSVERITKQLKIKEGGRQRIALTTIVNRPIMVILEQ